MCLPRLACVPCHNELLFDRARIRRPVPAAVMGGGRPDFFFDRLYVALSQESNPVCDTLWDRLGAVAASICAGERERETTKARHRSPVSVPLQDGSTGSAARSVATRVFASWH